MYLPLSGDTNPLRIKKSSTTSAQFGLKSSVAISSFTWQREEVKEIETSSKGVFLY